MKSIFNLKRDKKDLSSINQGMANAYYDEVLPLRNVIDTSAAQTAFGNGAMNFRWNYGSSWWLPSRSYFRFDIELTKVGGNPLDSSDDIAVGMNPCACLFSKLLFKINDQTISEVSEHVAQVQNVKQRLSKTGQWMLTTGDNLSMWESDFKKRQQKIVSDGLLLDEFQGSYEPMDFLDLVVPNQFTLAAANNRVTLLVNEGAAIPDLREYLAVGEYVFIDDGAGNVYRPRITAVAAGTFDVENIIADTGAAQGITIANLKRLKLKVPTVNRQVKKFSVIWQPPLSIFDVEHAIPACGKFEIEMTPFSNTVYQKHFIESSLADKNSGADFTMLVKNVVLQNLRVDGPIVEKDEFYLDLCECRAQADTLTSSDRSQYSLDISPSTYALTVAFQDSASESDSQYSQSILKVRNSEELKLSNFYIRYGGKQKPIPDYRPLYDSGSNQDLLVELYARNLYYDGSYYDSSKETLKEWRDRGMYLHFPWPKEGTDRETRAYISTEFKPETDGNFTFTQNPRIILFNHFKKLVICKIENGSLQSVQINEV